MMEGLGEGVREGWGRLKRWVELACHGIMGVGALALVIASWVSLSRGRQREALEGVAAVIMGAAGAVIYLERWICAAQAAVRFAGLLLGRSSRADSAKAVGGHLAAAAIWCVLWMFGPPIALGFGFPAAGAEDSLLKGIFFLLLVYLSVKIPERLRISWLAATMASAKPGELPPIGGVRF